MFIIEFVWKLEILNHHLKVPPDYVLQKCMEFNKKLSERLGTVMRNQVKLASIASACDFVRLAHECLFDSSTLSAVNF